MNALQQRALQVAKRYIGVKETTGRNDGPVVRMFQRYVAKGYAWLDSQPWCVCYVTYCVHAAAKELGVKPAMPYEASSSRLYAWAKKNGRLLKAPRNGCIGLVRRGGRGDQDGRATGGSSHIHCFLVHTVEPDGRLVTLEGNYRNSVGWGKRKASDPLDYVEIC